MGHMRQNRRKRYKRKVRILIILLVILVLLICASVFIHVKKEQTGVKSSTDGEKITEEHDAIAGKKQDAETNEIISYEIETENVGTGTYEYPKFVAEDISYSDVVDQLNKCYEEMLSSDSTLGYFQSINSVSVEEEESFLSVQVSRTQEVGGPHPNNYDETYVINTTTHDFANLSDVKEMDDATIDSITDQVYEEHSDLNYETLREDVEHAIGNNTAHWEIRDGEIVIWFDESDITGAYQGDGEFAAIIEK